VRRTIFFLILVAVAATLLARVPLRALVFQNAHETLSLRVVKPGDTFSLGYRHSVARSDVWDHFRIDSAYRMVLTETQFQGQGAGLPGGEAKQEKLVRDGRWFRLTGMERVVPVLFWRVDAKWNNRLRFKDEKEQNLSARAGNSLVRIQVRKINSWEWLAYRLTGQADGKWTVHGKN